MTQAPLQYLIFLKDRVSQRFEYKSDVRSVALGKNMYRIAFIGGKSYNYGFDRVKYYPLKSTREGVRIYEGGNLHRSFDTVDYYGKYLIFRGKGGRSKPIEESSDIEICDIKNDVDRSQSIIDYFRDSLKGLNSISFEVETDDSESTGCDQISTKILVRALDEIDMQDSRSALSNYVDGVKPSLTKCEGLLIYPFGCNESQKLAVETTLQNSMSIIEGPPGTGKTQTILNIVANLIVQNKRVAIVSNNNSAVFNVSEKLEKYGYGFVVASLGSNKNKGEFFEKLKHQVVDPSFEISKDREEECRAEIGSIDEILTKSFLYKNRLATLESQLLDAEIEFDHVKAEQPIVQEIKTALDNKFYRKWGVAKILHCKELLSKIDFEKKLPLLTKLRLVMSYGLLDVKSIYAYRDELPSYVNHKFYELTISLMVGEIAEIKSWLELNSYESNLEQFTKISKELFNGVLYRKYNNLSDSEFLLYDYKSKFEEFTNHYPVVTSSTLSLHTSIPDGFLFDYLIIDESSQVDVIKSAVCFSCSRNVVIVGDSMQLSHIVSPDSKAVSEQLQTKYNIDQAYNYVEKNILNSLKSLYGDSLKSVMLKEHYRCHPTIIGFCNKKYYNNELVIMTQMEGGRSPFRIIETKICGCNDRQNQRQADETNLYLRENYSDNYSSVGIISPYRDHANLLQRTLPNGAEADTIHKFQGREKGTIIFNTVRGKVSTFLDNPNLINVAVSRAEREFVVVKPESMELPHGTNIGDLIRYMYYTADSESIVVEGKVRSVFDLLYKEYNREFAAFKMSNKKIKGSAAEIIISKLLVRLLEDPRYSSIIFQQEYALRDLIKDYHLLTNDEVQFIKNNSKLDFLLYNKIDNSPVLAIEVDGVAFHSDQKQQERDRKKDHILEVFNLPLLRLSTDGFSEESQIVESLQNAMKLS